jgi:hypothetical protein
MLPVDWEAAENTIAPFLADPADWPQIRAELERRLVTRLALVGGDPSRPSAVEANSELRGWQIAGIDRAHLDPVGHALERLIEQLDLQGGVPGSVPSGGRPTRHGIGKKGTRKPVAGPRFRRNGLV